MPEKYRIWIEARRRHRLSDAHVQMARELGMNPKKLGKVDNHKQEPWKAPLPFFIEDCYEKRFGKRRPDAVKPLEQILREHEKKDQARRERRRMSQAQQSIDGKDLSIAREVDYIVGRAIGHDSRIVTLGGLVLFSTETGDAWMLDPEDNLALCLARNGSREPVATTQSKENFSIAWSHTYQIDEESILFADKAGQPRTIMGYPIREITQAIGQALSQPGGRSSLDRDSSSSRSE